MSIALRLLATLAASATIAGCQPADDAAFGQKVRAYLLSHPEVIREAVQELNKKEQANAALGAVANIRAHRAELERDPRDYVANPGGKITVVEFFDYRCGYCKVAAPEVLQLIQQNPDVRFVFKEFPIFGKESDTAAKIALTPAGKAKSLALYQSWMAEKSLDDAAIDRLTTAAGLDPAELRKQAADPAIAKQIADIRTLALALKIEGTPAFIIGDTMIAGADIPALKQAIIQAKAAAGLKQPAALK